MVKTRTDALHGYGVIDFFQKLFTFQAYCIIRGCTKIKRQRFSVEFSITVLLEIIRLCVC